MKRFIILSAAVAALFTTSCKKILQPETPSAFSEEYIFGNETDAKKAVNGVYALFNGDPYTSRVSTNFAGNTDVEAGGVAASPDNNRRDIWSFEATPSNPDLLTVWNTAYNAINRANECIEGIKASPIANNPNMKQLVGECKVLRAIWYKILIDHWGDVPFKTNPTKAGDEFYLAKTGRDTIMSFLIDDLIEAEPNMLWADQLDYGTERINREFTLGLIARIALFRGGYWLYPDLQMRRKDDFRKYYEIANTYTKKLMQLKPHNLTNFALLFNNINKSVKMANEDVLFEVAFAPGAGDVGWNIGVAVAAGTHNYGSSTVAMYLTPAYYHSFDTTDQRLPVTCSLISYDQNLVQQPVSVTSISIAKWNRLLRVGNLGPSTSKGTGVNWPLMRYSDVLLMLAESENELNGPTAVAQDALRKVRQRAFASANQTDKVDAYVAAASTSKQAFFDAIVKERAWEFGGEFLRKYDLYRWNIYGKVIAETIATMSQMGQDAVAGVGPYADLPDYLYYRRVGSNIEFYNKYRKPAVPPPLDPVTGYIRINWLRSLWNTTTNSPADYLLRQYRGYKDPTGAAPVKYILPIHGSIVTSSLGVLKNEYGY